MKIRNGVVFLAMILFDPVSVQAEDIAGKWTAEFDS